MCVCVCVLSLHPMQGELQAVMIVRKFLLKIIFLNTVKLLSKQALKLEKLF